MTLTFTMEMGKDKANSLLHFDGADEATTFLDEGGLVWTAHGDAQLDTSEKKFGTASLLLEKDTTDYISTPDSDNFNFGSDDFIIECFLRLNSTGIVQRICGQGEVAVATRSVFFYLDAANKLTAAIYSGSSSYVTSVTAATALSAGTQYYVAMVRVGNTLSAYLDEVLQGSIDVTGVSVNDVATDFGIGNFPAIAVDTYNFDGRIDEFRLIRGHAPESVTAPAAAYSAWIDITADVRNEEIKAFWGIKGSGPTDRIADTGNLTFTLENSWANSGGLTGYYSPDNANLRADFGLGTPIRIKLTDGTSVRYKKFYISAIDPEPGKFRGKGVVITAEDYVGRMSSKYATGLTVQTSKRVDQALTTLMATMPDAPAGVAYSTGLDTLPYVFHDVDGRRMSVMNILQRLLQSDLGYFFVDMNATNGEAATYQTRQDRILNASLGTLDNTMDSIELDHSGANIANLVAVVYHPVNVAASAEVLYTLQTETEIPAGKSVPITARYRDSGVGSQSIRLSPGTEVTPVADTDYEATTTPGGGGNDANASLSISVEWWADYAEVTLTNIGSATIYTGGAEIFQLRGKGIRLYDSAEAVVEDTQANLDRYGDMPLRFDLPYQNNVNTAADFANYLFNRWHLPGSKVKSSEFIAINSAALESAMLAGVIGSKWTHIESVTGINMEFCINGTEWTITPSGMFRARWFLEEASGNEFWFLGESGYSEIGETTILGF